MPGLLSVWSCGQFDRPACWYECWTKTKIQTVLALCVLINHWNECGLNKYSNKTIQRNVCFALWVSERVCVCVCVGGGGRVRERVQVWAHTHARAHARTHTHSHTHARKQTFTHTFTHALTHTHARTHLKGTFNGNVFIWQMRLLQVIRKNENKTIMWRRNKGTRTSGSCGEST